MKLSLLRRCVAELIGTFLMVLFGCGAMVVESQTGMLTHCGVAAAWGGIVAIMIYAIGDLSGCHLNPAVSIAFSAAGKFPRRDAVAYSAAHCLGAISAAAALAIVLGIEGSNLGVTQTILPIPAAWATEWLLTATLMFVVLGVSTGAKEKSITAGLAVGATIALEALVAGPLTKASMNPARSLGPAIVSGQLDLLWLYISAPIVGALCGIVVYRAIDVTRQSQYLAAPNSRNNDV